jgi:hypothetical protein
VRKSKLSLLSLSSVSITFKRELMIRIGQSQMVSNIVILDFTVVSSHTSTMGVYDHSLDCIYTKPSACISNDIQPSSPIWIYNTRCNRNFSFFISLFFLICSSNYIHLYVHSRVDWHSSISERRRENFAYTRPLIFFLFSLSLSLFVSYTHICANIYIYIYTCPRIEHFVLVMINV